MLPGLVNRSKLTSNLGLNTRCGVDLNGYANDMTASMQEVVNSGQAPRLGYLCNQAVGHEDVAM